LVSPVIGVPIAAVGVGGVYRCCEKCFKDEERVGYAA